MANNTFDSAKRAEYLSLRSLSKVSPIPLAAVAALLKRFLNASVDEEANKHEINFAKVESPRVRP